jgi:AcrR family transcriptional regulator
MTKGAKRMRLDTDVRKAVILDAACRAARLHGFGGFKREHVAAEARCSTGLVSTHWSGMKHLRRSVMRRAVAERDIQLVAQGLAAREPAALAAPVDLKRAALLTLL